jgi:hypothetical protein
MLFSFFLLFVSLSGRLLFVFLVFRYNPVNRILFDSRNAFIRLRNTLDDGAFKEIHFLEQELASGKTF